MFSLKFLNILLLLAAPLAYFFLSYRVILIIAAIVVSALVFVCRLDILNSFLAAAVFGVIQASAIAYKNILEQERRGFASKLEKEDERRRGLREKLEALEREERDMREDELMVVSLFEITKKMSGSLKFIDIFNVFSAFLKGNFSFRKCDLLVLNWESPDMPRLERSYSVWQDGDGNASKQIVNYGALIQNFLRNPRKIHASRDSGKDILDKIGMEDPLVGTFTAIPLFNERMLAAILTVENMPTEELERFLILSTQFALEIKKVLLYETVEKLAITDSLTGLYLRKYFYDRMGEELQRSRRYKFEFAFLMIDIDDFKRANDTYGHLVGDVVLKELGHIIKESVREIDLVSRYGGEEFAVVLPETAPQGAMLVADRIRKKIEDHIFKAYDETLKITISTGVSAYPEDSNEINDLIDRADAAMYDAKKSGKNVVCRYKK